MNHPCTIAGREVELEWTQETAKRFAFRMSDIGEDDETLFQRFNKPKKAASGVFKALWGMLPTAEFARYPDPESLFVAVDHEIESASIFAAVKAIYQERYPDPEKKSTSMKSPSPESNSG